MSPIGPSCPIYHFPMTRLSAPDLAIVAVYIAGMTLLGVWFTRKQKDLRTYFVGGRNVGWFMVLMSIVATETSAVTFLSVPGLGVQPEGREPHLPPTRLRLHHRPLPGRLVAAAAVHARRPVLRLPGAARSGSARRCSGPPRGLFLATRTVADGLRLFLTALLAPVRRLGRRAGDPGRGGRDHRLHLPGRDEGGHLDRPGPVPHQDRRGGAGRRVRAAPVARRLGPVRGSGDAAGKFKLIELGFDPTSAYNLWAGVIGGAVFSMASHGADQLMVQRYLCARSLGQARLALVLSGFVVLVAVPAVPGRRRRDVSARTGAASSRRRPGPRNDEVFGLFIVTQLPPGWSACLVAAVLAAAMSTLSSSLNSSANAFVTDFYRPLRPNHPRGWYVTLSRAMTAVWGVAQMAVACRGLPARRRQERGRTGAGRGRVHDRAVARPVRPRAACGGRCGRGRRWPAWCAGSRPCWRCGCRGCSASRCSPGRGSPPSGPAPRSSWALRSTHCCRRRKRNPTRPERKRRLIRERPWRPFRNRNPLSRARLSLSV